MNKMIMAALISLCSPALTYATTPPAPPAPPAVEQYHISTQLLKGDVSMHQGQLLTLSNTMTPYSEYTETHLPTSTGFNPASPHEPIIKRGVVRTGFTYYITCAPASTPNTGKISCRVEGEVTDNTTPVATSEKTLKNTEEAANKGGQTLTFPVITSSRWEHNVMLHDGQQAAMTMGQYQFKMTVRKTLEFLPGSTKG